MAEARGTGYAARMLAQRQEMASDGWLSHGLVLGGLSAAAAAAWRGLAAHPTAQLAVAAYLAVEGIWYTVGKLRFYALSRLYYIQPDTSRLPELFERFLGLRDVMCIREFLSGWFMGAPAEAVLRGNVEHFVAYGFHCRLMHDLSRAEQETIRRFVDEVEAAWGVRFQPGFDEDLPFMAHLWEPLRAYHKPLLLFAITELLARIANLLMFLMGFRPARQGHFTYWHAPPLAGSGSSGSGSGSCALGAAGSLPAEPLSPPMSPHAISPPPRGSTGLRRHSTSEAVVEAVHHAAEAVHHAADAVHHAAEHALDATLTVTSTAAAAFAAQHPHGVPTPLSPRAPSPAALRAISPSPGRAPAAAAAGDAAAGAAAAAAAAEGSGGAAQRGGAAAGASDASLRRRRKADSATDYSNMPLEAEAAGGAEVEPAMQPAVRGAAGAAGADMDSADAEVRLMSPFSAAAAAAGAPGSQPQQQQNAAVQRGVGSPSDSVGSGAGAAGAGRGAGTRPDVPIVFLHGVGFGCLPYLHLVRDIQQACPDTPILMVEVPHVALRLCWEAQEVDDVAHAVAAALRRHGYRRACVMGHSYGTFVASRLCQLHPKLVHSACLLDPVAMLLCYPQLLYNFIYKEPSAANFTSVMGAVDLLRFLCSRDLTIAQAICRKFLWSELMLWPQDLPRRSLVVLSGQDDLVPSDLVMAHIKLTGHPAKVMHHPQLGHGGILLSPVWQAQFVANLRAMLEC